VAGAAAPADISQLNTGQLNAVCGVNRFRLRAKESGLTPAATYKLGFMGARARKKV
jgi:hypothetical protein